MQAFFPIYGYAEMSPLDRFDAILGPSDEVPMEDHYRAFHRCLVDAYAFNGRHQFIEGRKVRDQARILLAELGLIEPFEYVAFGEKHLIGKAR